MRCDRTGPFVNWSSIRMDMWFDPIAVNKLGKSVWINNDWTRTNYLRFSPTTATIWTRDMWVVGRKFEQLRVPQIFDRILICSAKIGPLDRIGFIKVLGFSSWIKDTCENETHKQASEQKKEKRILMKTSKGRQTCWDLATKMRWTVFDRLLTNAKLARQWHSVGTVQKGLIIS